jgi:voltage-gated potassium channel
MGEVGAEGPTKRLNRLRLLWLVLRRSGVERIILVFLAIYAILSLVVWLAEPGVHSYLDALWFLWAVTTTVGLGDVTAVTLIGRVATVIDSIMGMVVIALFTGVVVDYFNECRSAQFDESLVVFLDKMEHLDELDKAELTRISRKVRELREGHGSRS